MRREYIHHTFPDSDEMVAIKISPFEAELLSSYWLGLVNAHNGMRAMDCHSVCEYKQDIYALERCEAFITAGLMSQQDFEATRAAVFAVPVDEDTPSIASGESKESS